VNPAVRKGTRTTQRPGENGATSTSSRLPCETPDRERITTCCRAQTGNPGKIIGFGRPQPRNRGSIERFDGTRVGDRDSIACCRCSACLHRVSSAVFEAPRSCDRDSPLFRAEKM